MKGLIQVPHEDTELLFMGVTFNKTGESMGEQVDRMEEASHGRIQNMLMNEFHLCSQGNGFFKM